MVKRFSREPATHVDSYPDGLKSIVLYVSDETRSLVLLELSLLSFGLSDVWIIEGTSRIALSATSAPSGTQNGSSWEVGLTHTSLEALLAYLLKWARDGLAEVDHIDVEIRGTPLTLTIRGGPYRPPLSEAAAVEALFGGRKGRRRHQRKTSG